MRTRQQILKEIKAREIWLTKNKYFVEYRKNHLIIETLNWVLDRATHIKSHE